MTDTSRPVPAVVRSYRSKDGILTVGGERLDRLADRAGQTPFYVYDRARVSRRIANLRKNLPGAIELHYAIKANPMPALVQHIAGRVDGLDVASVAEMSVALDSGMAPEAISFAGPGKTETEIFEAVAAGIIINLESETQMRMAAKAGRALNVRPKVALRINPDFELKSSGMRMGGGAQQFGVDAETAPGLLKKIAKANLELCGFHIFSGSQNLKEGAIIETMGLAVDLALALAKGHKKSLTHINIGGGLGIPYFAGEKPLNVKKIGAALAPLSRRVAKSLPGVKIVLELGRFIVGEAGLYVCKVIEVKKSRGETFLITDGGLHHHLAASGNFGQVLRRNYPLVIGNKMDQPASHTVNVVGPLCTPLDILGAKTALPKAAAGDLIVVFQSGAYGLTASPTRFLSHPGPAEILV